MKRIAVLYGGRSAEREVSLVSGRACASALRESGFDSFMLDTAMPLDELIAILAGSASGFDRQKGRPDAVFNALHGRGGEDGCVQGVLELLKLPYTHSGVLTSALAMDKIQAKRVLRSGGVPVAEDCLVTYAALQAMDPLPRPYVVKPHNEGSSVGVFILRDATDKLPDPEDWPFGDSIMVEPYIAGRELTVAVMDRTQGGLGALAVTEIIPQQGFYDYAAKYQSAQAAQHIVPAPLPKPAYEYALQLAETAHVALGCRGVSRADFRYDDRQCDAEGIGQFVMLEVNTQPGMTALSLVPEQAAYCGLSFAALCRWLVEQARCDQS